MIFNKHDSKEIYLKKLKEYSLKQKIPIIHDETLIFLQKIIKQNNFLHILEIGTALGYSALAMANSKNHIQTVERDYQKYQYAIDFFQHIPYCIEFIWAEAFFYQPQKKYDLIFIDAAKVQYQKLFQKYSFFLNKKGSIICDNLNFHNLDVDDPEVSRSSKRIIKKLNSFKEFLKQNNQFKTLFTNIGDGLSISWKK